MTSVLSLYWCRLYIPCCKVPDYSAGSHCRVSSLRLRWLLQLGNAPKYQQRDRNLFRGHFSLIGVRSHLLLCPFNFLSLCLGPNNLSRPVACLPLGLLSFVMLRFCSLRTPGLFWLWETYYPWDLTGLSLSLQWSCIAYLSDVIDSFCSLPELQSHINDCLLVISSGMCQSFVLPSRLQHVQKQPSFFATNQLLL